VGDDDLEKDLQRLRIKGLLEEKERAKEESGRIMLLAFWLLPFFGMVLLDSHSRLAAIWFIGGLIAFLIREHLQRRR
jgi:hypothetical protein